MAEKKPLTEARKRSIDKYLSQFSDVKIRVRPAEKERIQQHAASMGESMAAFITRAIMETIERDKSKK